MLKVKRRFTEHFKTGKPLTLGAEHDAVIEGRTIFPSRRSEATERLLKSGEHQRKIGSHVVKGKWSGMPIFTLTLEERATCPRLCQHWNNCYGNKMHWPKRYKHGAELEERLEKELTSLNALYPDGFVVRLHILGDFYSVHYVMSWGRWLQRFPALHIFGYTAREMDEDIGLTLQDIHKAFAARFWVRWSHRDKDTWLSTGDNGIICPVQTGKVDSCGNCGLCWAAKKPIKFLVH